MKEKRHKWNELDECIKCKTRRRLVPRNYQTMHFYGKMYEFTANDGKSWTIANPECID